MGVVAGTLFAAIAAAARGRGWKVAYTRKLFHFTIFSTASVVHVLGGLGATNAYGLVVAALVLGAVRRGDGDPFYEALARDSDRPHRSLFIVVPLVTTAAGGLVAALLAGPYAAVGYLVAGWGDAVGEPVGARWGRHRYRVPSLRGVPAERSWEGSAAVLLVGWVAAATALLGLGAGAAEALRVGAAVAAAGAAAEALSHHGTDNLTVPIVTALAARALAG